MWMVESRRINQAVDSAIVLKTAEFNAAFTAKESLSPDQRLADFLARSLPEDGEIIWSFPASAPASYIGNKDKTLLNSPKFRPMVERLRESGGLETLEIDRTVYRIGVQPIHQGSDRAALVVTRNVTKAREPLVDLMRTYALVAILSLAMVTLCSSWLAGRLLQPIRVLRDTAREISSGSLDERLDVTGQDDLADLQVTFNEMLDRLELAFTSQRQMLDDAGHELRTPLTVLQGHLEVMDAADPNDVAETRSLLLDEIARMSRLVNDLLLLAKSRRPDFVQPHPTDLGRLGEGIFSRCTALADRDWVANLQADAIAMLDEQRITQAMLQLAENAVQHTAAGDTITIGSTSTATEVEFWVSDSGAGVDPQIREQIFDRFATAGSPDGIGLGLAIIGAIAQAHCGTISLDDAQAGSGATFRLRLPLTQEA